MVQKIPGLWEHSLSRDREMRRSPNPQRQKQSPKTSMGCGWDKQSVDDWIGWIGCTSREFWRNNYPWPLSKTNQIEYPEL